MNLYINNNKKYKELFPKKHYSNIKNILITEDIDPKCVNILETNGFNVTKNVNLTKEELKEEIKVSFFSSLINS